MLLGPTSLPRPADVLRVVNGFRPGVAADNLAEVAGGMTRLDDAMASLGPGIVVRRRADDALATLTRGGAFSTIHDLGSSAGDAQRQARSVAIRHARETQLDMFGDGADAGRTGYGMVFSEAAAPNLAVPAGHRFGDVSFVLRPEALRRATFAERDTGVFTMPDNVLGGVEQLGQVVARRADFGVARTTGVRQALAGVFDHSLRTPMAHVEAQVRGLHLDDVQRIVLADSAGAGFGDIERWAARRGIAVERQLPEVPAVGVAR